MLRGVGLCVEIIIKVEGCRRKMVQSALRSCVQQGSWKLQLSIIYSHFSAENRLFLE